MSDYRKSRKFVVLAWLSIVFCVGLLILALFRPTVGFEVLETQGLKPDSDEFLRQTRMMSAAPLYEDCEIEVLTNGKNFYEAELESISAAQSSIYIEVYIFEPGEIADRFREVLTARARAGVDVRLILDAVGSMNIPLGYFSELRKAGGSVAFYHSVSWHTWDRINNRTHREIYLIDNSVAFLGGAGIGDHWWKDDVDQLAWQDTMFKLTGEAVDSVSSVFLENWVEASGEILPANLPPASKERERPGRPCFVVGSTPSIGGSSRARILYQFFVESAQESILINNPYFLPDKDLRGALVRAAQRGVEIRIVLPGGEIDWEMTRSASRRNLGELLAAGIDIREYQPTMNHRKIMVVDRLWNLVGTTNLDSRSFGLNDEINLIARDAQLATRLESDFKTDLEKSDTVTYEEWKTRPWLDRVHEFFSGLLARQQ